MTITMSLHIARTRQMYVWLSLTWDRCPSSISPDTDTFDLLLLLCRVHILNIAFLKCSLIICRLTVVTSQYRLVLFQSDVMPAHSKAVAVAPDHKRPRFSAHSKAVAAVPDPKRPRDSAPSETEAAVPDTDAVVAAWYALLPGGNYPKLQSRPSRMGKWLNWARPMGSACPSAVGQRARSPARLATVRTFQEVLSAHMASAGGSFAEDTRCLMALYPAVKAAQRAYLDRDSDTDYQFIRVIGLKCISDTFG